MLPSHTQPVWKKTKIQFTENDNFQRELFNVYVKRNISENMKPQVEKR